MDQLRERIKAACAKRVKVPVYGDGNCMLVGILRQISSSFRVGPEKKAVFGGAKNFYGWRVTKAAQRKESAAAKKLRAKLVEFYGEHWRDVPGLFTLPLTTGRGDEFNQVPPYLECFWGSRKCYCSTV